MFSLIKSELSLVWSLFTQDAGHNRKRMLLTVVAIGWGTLSIVMLLSFGEGMKRAFHKGTRGMGENIGVLWPGSTTRAYGGMGSGRSISFQDDDGEMLLARIPSLAAVSREYSRRRGLTVGEKTVNARVRGVDPSFGWIRNHVPQPGGRFINEEDIRQKRRVIFLGEELAWDLFGSQDVVGRELSVNQSVFQVIGVAQKKTMMGMYSGPDKNQAAIPATTLRAMYTDARVDNFIYLPKSLETADLAKAEIYRVLAAKYRFDPEDRRALSIWDTRDNQRITDNIALGIQIFLGIIGALTLFVGGMGVANIMYAVVKERTREIGIKMALGAKARQVMAPFVLESMVITGAGGALGTAVSLSIITIIGLLPLQGDAFDLMGIPTFSPGIAIATSLILGAVGMFAGYFPARRAASINPAESLRYE
ncbi:MAG: ABC transporter permease [Vicinamibacteria bacterium]|nr:ABC transporter permease [Vicinamibacteria bacterium]